MEKSINGRIKQRIRELEQQRAQLFAQMTATSGAIAELKRLLGEEEGPEDSMIKGVSEKDIL